uniref:Uncharacterized protein n=1 Tax=Arundo donax TaxID=35708 RepID=A0A0A9BIW6_ARUDO
MAHFSGGKATRTADDRTSLKRKFLAKMDTWLQLKIKGEDGKMVASEVQEVIFEDETKA